MKHPFPKLGRNCTSFLTGCLKSSDSNERGLMNELIFSEINYISPYPIRSSFEIIAIFKILCLKTLIFSQFALGITGNRLDGIFAENVT